MKPFSGSRFPRRKSNCITNTRSTTPAGSPSVFPGMTKPKKRFSLTKVLHCSSSQEHLFSRTPSTSTDLDAKEAEIESGKTARRQTGTGSSSREDIMPWTDRNVPLGSGPASDEHHTFVTLDDEQGNRNIEKELDKPRARCTSKEQASAKVESADLAVATHVQNQISWYSHNYRTLGSTSQTYIMRKESLSADRMNDAYKTTWTEKKDLFQSSPDYVQHCLTREIDSKRTVLAFSKRLDELKRQYFKAKSPPTAPGRAPSTTGRPTSWTVGEDAWKPPTNPCIIHTLRSKNARKAWLKKSQAIIQAGGYRNYTGPQVSDSDSELSQSSSLVVELERSSNSGASLSSLTRDGEAKGEIDEEEEADEDTHEEQNVTRALATPSLHSGEPIFECDKQDELFAQQKAQQNWDGEDNG